MALNITGETAVTLEGYSDADRKLQFRYGTQELSDFDDTIVCFSDDPVRVTLTAPSGSTITASHEEGRNAVEWQAGTDSVYHSFSSGMTDPVQVDAQAPPSLPKNVFVHIKPTGGLPDT